MVSASSLDEVIMEDHDCHKEEIKEQGKGFKFYEPLPENYSPLARKILSSLKKTLQTNLMQQIRQIKLRDDLSRKLKYACIKKSKIMT